MKVVGICLVLGLLVLGCYAQNTTLCRESFHQMLPITLIQMEDYTGKSPYDMGNYDGCQGLNSTAVHYCVAQTEIPTGKVHSIANVYMGICVPSQCDENTLEILLRDGIEDLNVTYFNHKIPELADATFTCVPRGLYKFTWGAIVSIVLFTLIGFLVLLGTTVDYFESEAIARMKRANRFSEDRAPLVSSQGNTAEITRLPGEEARNVHLNAEFAPKRKPGKLMEFLKCFAIGPNLGFLVKDNRGGEPGLAHMNGLRCLMMFWIILSHTFAYVNAPVGFDNIRVITQDLLERVSFQVIPAGELAVDGFFYLSGFLVAYMVLKEMKHSKNQRIPWGLFYFHRYWRLTPVYGCIILFYTTITPFLIYGPFAHLYRSQKTELCVKYWWTNLLYINNFYPNDSNNQCFGWGWYLANDMQFFIISPLFILLFKKNRAVSFAVLSFLSIASLVTMGSIVGKNELEPLGMNEHWNSQAYGKPYTRIPPYLVGLGFAFLVQYENIDLLRKWYVRWFAYAVSFTFTTCCTYLTYGYWNTKGWENWQNVMYAVTSRSLFVLGLACFTYACYKGHGGILNTVLSAYFWLPLARLTYTAYLTHPVIIFVINYSTTTIFHYSSIYMAVRYCSHLLLAYSVAIVFHLSIEKPTANLERIILPPRGKH